MSTIATSMSTVTATGGSHATARRTELTAANVAAAPNLVNARLTTADDHGNVAPQREASMSRVKRSVACIVAVAALMVLVGNQPAPGQSKPGARKLDLAHIIPPPESGAIGFKYLADE